LQGFLLQIDVGEIVMHEADEPNTPPARSSAQSAVFGQIVSATGTQIGAYNLGRARRGVSKRVWADDFPAVALIEFVAFVVVARAAFRERFNEDARGGRGVEKQHAAGFAAAVLPGMRDVAGHERAGAGPADGNLVADLEGDLTGEDPGDLVAVAVQMDWLGVIGR
jgi:hypothetical protein